MNLPSGLYEKVKAVIKNRNELGYRSITEFVAESVRNKLTEMGETTPKPPNPKLGGQCETD